MSYKRRSTSSPPWPRPTVINNTTLSLRIGTECIGICALSVALDRLHVAVDYVFACDCDVHCQKQLRALAVPPKVIYDNMETRKVENMQSVHLYVLGSQCQSSPRLKRTG